MNKRERVLLILIGAGIGLFALYQGINFLFVSPIGQAQAKIEDLVAENERLERLTRSRKRLVKEWMEDSTRTISYEAAEISNRFSPDIKRTAARNGFANPLVTPVGQSKIGSKTDISTIVFRVNVDGPYENAMKLLNELYTLPYFVRISKLSIVPLVQKNRGRNEVKLEFTIETPLLPRIDKKKMPDAAQALAMIDSDSQPTTPAREDLPDPRALAILTTRNIFKAYMPPPPNEVKIDNQDLKTVALKVTFFWEGTPSEQLVDTVAGKSQKPLSGKGDVVEIQGTYADAVKFGPERLDFNLTKNAVYVVKSHTPPPPPEVIDLAVENQAKDAVDVEVKVTSLEGKLRTLPTMRIRPGRMDIDEYDKVKTVQVAATYASGKKAAAMTFNPKSGKQTYTVPAEGAEPVVTAPVAAVGDQPADPTMSVSGLVTYNGTQEMVGSAGGTRKVFAAGIEAAVDGGMLLGVHPLGGVVRMPSGNFYLYPLGMRFAERVKLAAAKEEELAAAIDECAANLAEKSIAQAGQAPASPPGGQGLRGGRPNPTSPAAAGKPNGRPR